MATTSKLVCEDLLQLLSKFKASIGDIAEEYGLTVVQTHALYILHNTGGLPMGHVAGALHCDPSNVTGIIDRLVAQQLVGRQEDVNDRRTKRLEITDKGRSIIEKLLGRLPEELGCAKLSSSEQTNVHHALQKLLA
jgi:DNA-binding MarR family transcriptional regulator